MTRYDFLESADIFGNSVIIHNNSFGVYNTYADKEIVPPIYEELYILSNDLFAIRKGSLWGVINSKNEYITYPKFKSIVAFDSDFIQLNFSYDSFWLMSKNEPYNRTSFSYSSCSFFKNDYCVAVRDGLYGVLHRTLTEVIPATYNNIVQYKEDLFLAQTKDNVVLINSKNKILKTFDYSSIQRVNDLFSYIFTTKNSSSNTVMGVLDDNLNEVVPAKYDEIIPCSNNRLIVKVSDKYGVIALDGSFVIDCNYSYIISSNDNMFFYVFSDNLKPYIFDVNGTLITTRFAESIKRVGDGFAVNFDGKWCVMDSNYNRVSAIIYDSVDSISEYTKIGKKIATVTYRGRKGFFYW